MYLRYPLSLARSFALSSRSPCIYVKQQEIIISFPFPSTEFVAWFVFNWLRQRSERRLKNAHTFEYWIQEIGSQLKSSSLLERFCFMLLNSFAQSAYYNLQINGSNEHVGCERTGVKMVSKKFDGANITNENEQIYCVYPVLRCI